MKLNAKQLRKMDKPSKVQSNVRNDLYIVLDNVLDTYNIGSIFRLADAVAAKKVFLCAGSETPPNHRIKKASINTTEIVDWEYKDTAADAVKELKRKINNLQVVAVEQNTKSVPYDQFNYKQPLCLIVGNETAGVSKEALDLADRIVEIPMYGVNISLNVMVSLGIVLYEVIEKTAV